MLLSCVFLWMIKYATGFTQRPLENMFDNFAVYSNVINVRGTHPYISNYYHYTRVKYQDSLANILIQKYLCIPIQPIGLDLGLSIYTFPQEFTFFKRTLFESLPEKKH